MLPSAEIGESQPSNHLQCSDQRRWDIKVCSFSGVPLLGFGTHNLSTLKLLLKTKLKLKSKQTGLLTWQRHLFTTLGVRWYFYFEAPCPDMSCICTVKEQRRGTSRKSQKFDPNPFYRPWVPSSIFICFQYPTSISLYLKYTHNFYHIFQVLFMKSIKF